jgi:hypothetical protein
MVTNILKIETPCNQWEGAASIQGPQLLNLGLGGGGKGFFFLFGVVMCSYHVPKFSMCSPRAFSIAPDFKLICFAQNPPLLTYITGVFFARGIIA